MLKFSSKSDVNSDCKCIVRLLDDSEVIECDIQVIHRQVIVVSHPSITHTLCVCRKK